MFDFLSSIINEIRSYFVPEQVVYDVTGECKNVVNAVIICIALIRIPRKNLR